MRTSKNYGRPRPMFPTQKPKNILLILFISLAALGIGLVGCMPAQMSPTPVSTPSATITTLPTFTSVAPLPTPTPWTPNVLTVSTPISSPAPIPISTTTAIYPLDNLRMAYIVDGNLYVQDSSTPLKKLSDSGKVWYPMFSDDGEKIIFYRGKQINDYNSIFSVNANGSQEQEIITTAWLDTLGAGTKAGHLAFIPNTHQFLFNTYLCPDNDDMYSGCEVGLFLADTNTGKLKEIVKPTLGGRLLMDGDSRWGGNFSVSPDGNLLSIAHAGQIDILSINGKVIHRNIMEYPPGMPIELYPRIYWFSDSSGFIAALPAEKEYKLWVISGDPAYTIWRYTFEGNIATQIPLDPPLLWAHMESNDIISISPNREWIIYFTEGYKLYRGNLLDGSTELLLPYWWFLPMEWSSDNKHFGSGLNPQAALGSVNEPLGLLPGYFIGWIDIKRFIYLPSFAENTQILVGEINQGVLLSYKSNVTIPPKAYITFIVLNDN